MTWAFDRRRYQAAWLKLRPSEAQVQEAILQALEALGVRALAVDAGAKTLRGRATAAIRRAGGNPASLKGRTGIKAGLADIVGALPGGRALFLEVKRPCWLDQEGHVIRAAGKPTPEQVNFLHMMQAQGALCGVAWSTEEAVALVRGALPERSKGGRP